MIANTGVLLDDIVQALKYATTAGWFYKRVGSIAT